jgi:hypothetical protein
MERELYIVNNLIYLRMIAYSAQEELWSRVHVPSSKN